MGVSSPRQESSKILKSAPGDEALLSELPDDLLRSELLSSWHLVPSLGLHHPEILSLGVVTFKGGRSPKLVGIREVGTGRKPTHRAVAAIEFGIFRICCKALFATFD